MNRIYRLIFILLFIYNAKYSLANGSLAPDIMLKDINGNDYQLHQILESGKHVIILFAASWCVSSWKYHRSGRLKSLWEMYGPDGTNEIMIFLVESDLKTNANCIKGSKGCVGGTLGNWAAKTPYPIVNLTGKEGQEVLLKYRVSSFPEIILIKANDKRKFKVGQLSVSEWQSWLYQSFRMYSMAKTVNEDGENSELTKVNLTVFNGAGPKSYKWSNGSNSDEIYFNSKGKQWCRITDKNGYFIITEIDLADKLTAQEYIHKENYQQLRDNSFDINVVRSIKNEPEISQNPLTDSEKQVEVGQRNNANFKVYPNPAFGYINVSVDIEEAYLSDVWVTDKSGKTVLLTNFNGTDHITLDIGDIAQGVYFVTFKYQELIYTKKLFVIK